METIDAPRRLLTAAEVADLLGLSVRHTRRLTAELGGFRVADRSVRFERTTIEAWLERRKAEAKQKQRL